MGPDRGTIVVSMMTFSLFRFSDIQRGRGLSLYLVLLFVSFWLAGVRNLPFLYRLRIKTESMSTWLSVYRTGRAAGLGGLLFIACSRGGCRNSRHVHGNEVSLLFLCPASAFLNKLYHINLEH